MAYDHDHSDDIFIGADGRSERRSQRVVDADEALTGPYSGGICVHAGATFEISRGGEHSGSLTFRSGSGGRIVGRHSGSLHVSERSDVLVVGDQSGSVHVDSGAVLKVAAGGKLAGSLHVAGLIENRGLRGGSVHLEGGEIRDVDGGTVKQPTSTGEGTAVYNW
jgi:hypothetical protein